MSNKHALLNLIREEGPISRTALAKAAQMRMATITELTRQLFDEELIVEAGLGDSARGRKRRLLNLNGKYGYAVGLEFDADHLSGVVMDFTARPIVRHSLPNALPEDRDAIITELCHMVDWLIEASNIPRDRILGIGVADPGLVDPERGVSVMSSTINGWQNVPLAQLLTEHFGVPVYMEEGTRARAYAEREFGVARTVDHFMFIDFGPGIGCGLYICGLHHGFSGSAGEIGHTRVLPDGPVCRCGSYGCLEAVASLPAIARRAKEAIRQGAVSTILHLANNSIEQITAQHVFEACRKEDKLAMSIVTETGTFLGIAIANAINLINPQMVVFESSFGRVEDLMLYQIQNTVKRQGLLAATKELEFAVSELGDESAALGVAAIAIDTAFKMPQRQEQDSP